MKTAVEWLVHQLGLLCTTDHEDEIHEALEMEKEQMKDYDFYRSYWEVRNKKKCK